MRYSLVYSALLALAAAGCGNEIGDSCGISTDCSQTGEWLCDKSSPGGYCTVLGCDYDTCPEEAVCVRFFSLTNSNVTCDPATEDRSTDDCTADELCPLVGSCVPRSAEIRYCMRSCDSGDDCRDNYECRNEELMKLHGGEPVTRPGSSGGSTAKFCAPDNEP